MNNKRQAGKISRLMLVIIIAGISYGAYVAKEKKLLTSKTFLSIKTQVTDSLPSFNAPYSGYGVQLMATSQLNQAKSLMNDFATDGYSAFVVASESKGRTWYKVRLGPYAHKPEAVAIKDKVIRRYPNNPYVKASLVIYKPK